MPVENEWTDTPVSPRSLLMPAEFGSGNAVSTGQRVLSDMKSTVIKGEPDIARGVEYLRRIEPRFATAADAACPLPLRLRAEGFTTLLDIIVSQQLSVASADAIWSRMKNAGLADRSALCSAGLDELRSCGLSRQKSQYAIALAKSEVDFSTLSELDDDDVVKRLIRIRGIGVWTVEIYAMFALGRSDVLAAGDLALQESARLLFNLEDRPTEGALREMARAWSPWRSVAARLLWAYYRIAVKREGVR